MSASSKATNNLNKQDVYQVLNSPATALELSFKQWEQLIRVLRQEMLLGRFANAFMPQVKEIEKQDLRRYVKKHLENALLLTNRQNDSVLYEVEQLSTALKTIDSPTIYLKGCAYSIAKNAASVGRTYGDIDVLIERQALHQAENELMLHAWFVDEIDDYDDKYYRQWAHEIPPLVHASRGTVLDLHHNLIPPVSGRAPDISLFTRNLVNIDGSFVFRPAAMTLHSIVHLFINEDFKHGMRDLSDISLMFKSYDSNEFWQDIIELAQGTDFSTELFLAYRYCQKIFPFAPKSEPALQISQRPFSYLRLKYWDFIFASALAPKHNLVSNKRDSFAIFLSYIRGHSAKMPIRILLPHILTKAYRKVVELMAGKYFFSKENDDTTKP